MNDVEAEKLAHEISKALESWMPAIRWYFGGTDFSNWTIHDILKVIAQMGKIYSAKVEDKPWKNLPGLPR